MDQDKKDLLKNRINSLKGEMDSLDNQLDLNNYDLNPTNDLLPKLDLEYEIHDYEEEIKKITLDCIETLDCMSNLYLTEEELQKKNIKKIVNNDANALSELKFSLSCSKRGLINLMKQLDMGINDPEMYQAVGTFQKEIRESIKMLYELQKKIKDFYKEMKDELNSINSGDKEKEQPNQNTFGGGNLHIVDKKKLNKMLEDIADDKENEKSDD
jgi:hypothetical protein